jgi:hypothetical protein
MTLGFGKFRSKRNHVRIANPKNWISPIRRIGFGFRDELPRNLLDISDVIQHRFLKTSNQAAARPQ